MAVAAPAGTSKAEQRARIYRRNKKIAVRMSMYCIAYIAACKSNQGQVVA